MDRGVYNFLQERSIRDTASQRDDGGDAGRTNVPSRCGYRGALVSGGCRASMAVVRLDTCRTDNLHLLGDHVSSNIRLQHSSDGPTISKAEALRDATGAGPFAGEPRISHRVDVPLALGACRETAIRSGDRDDTVSKHAVD